MPRQVTCKITMLGSHVVYDLDYLEPPRTTGLAEIQALLICQRNITLLIIGPIPNGAGTMM